MLAVLIALALLGINIAAFVLFGWDKVSAENRRWRVPEAKLLLLALCGGAFGATLGQQFFRHKTRKEPFRSVLFAFLGPQRHRLCSSGGRRLRAGVGYGRFAALNQSAGERVLPPWARTRANSPITSPS
jgi:uncharacterized membrane protein YsdA (DUF1294 family)